MAKRASGPLTEAISSTIDFNIHVNLVKMIALVQAEFSKTVRQIPLRRYRAILRLSLKYPYTTQYWASKTRGVNWS
jgi:hypothetical protein